MLSLRFAAVSDLGRVRKKNDDSGYVGPHLIVVADGMGGAPAGDLASAVAIQTIRRLDAPPPKDLLQALAGTILIANERLAELIEEDPAVDGMGTTITAALFDGARIGVAHLGDSRGYLWRDGSLQRITRDHTWVQSLIDEGRITEDEAKAHSHRSLLLKVLDGRHDNEPDLSMLDVQPGDRILICSDGLSGVVSDERIEQVLRAGSAQSVASELTTLALESGSTDNVTVLVGDVVDEDEASPAEAVVVGAAGDTHRGPLARMRCWGQRDATEPREILMTDREVDPEELRYAPRAPRRLLNLRRAALLIVALAIIGGGLALAYKWSQTQYFVAADGDRVAIYQGVDAELPGIALNHVYQDQSLRLAELPGFRRSQVVDGLPADSLAKARSIVAELLHFARQCTAAPTTPTTTPTLTLPPPPPPTPSGIGTPSGTRPPPSAPTTPASPPATAPVPTPTTIAPPTGLVPPAGGHRSSTPRTCAGSTSSSGTPR